MTEEKILEILLPKQYDYPKLNAEAASAIASSFTDIIYDTLKLKSSLPTTKRLNVLKFLKSIASGSDNHVTVDEKNYPTFIKSLESQYIETDGFEDFLKQNDTELGQLLPIDLRTEVQDFYKRKNQKHQKKIKQLESVKKHDQEVLDKSGFSARITRNISYYETNENIICKLLNSNSVRSCDNGSTVDITKTDYREKQIKFAYALLHLGKSTTLKKVLQRLQKYQCLTNFEINFLLYLSENGDKSLCTYLVENFFFVFEKLVIGICTEIIQLEEDQVLDFFEQLLFQKKYTLIKDLCQDEIFRLKITNILFELYSFSFCNRNLLKFIDFLL